eukprot:scaffold683_cov124-Cylindrotheca_fusiformis.AAC.19
MWRRMQFFTRKSNKPSPKAVMHLALLLMNPTTRRFEFLQLPFDSDKALVSDIIAQIHIHATEASIKNQQYDGVVDTTGTTMYEFVRLADFCEGKTVLVALPKGLSVNECLHLARPLLCDKQVEKMGGSYARSSGKVLDEMIC